MPPITTYANYSITFADQAEYEFAVTAAGGNIYDAAPFSAAAFFGIPWPPPSGDLSQIPRTLIGYLPYGVAISPVEVLNPGPSGVFMQNNVDSVFVPGQAGNPASIFPAGDGINVVWSGIITRHNGENGIPDPGDIAAIPQRRWIAGMEISPSLAEGGSPNVSNPFGRDASRTFDGVGIAVRGGNTNSTSFTKTVSDYDGALLATESWERFYIRLRVLPSANYEVWKCQGTPNTGQGQELKISPAGNIEIYSQSSSEVLQGTVGPLPLNTWVRIDVIALFRVASNNGRFRLWLNGNLEFDMVQGSGTGLFANTRHTNSIMCSGASETTIELDVDDWINAEVPRDGGGAELLNSVDWLMGSHVKPVWTVSGVVTNWTPNAPQLGNQGRSNLISTNNSMSSSTSGASIENLTDATNDPDNTGLAVGVVSSVVGSRVSNASGTDGQLGYLIAGGAPAMTTIDESGSLTTRTIMYRPTGMFFPDDIVPYSIRRTKSADGNASVTAMLQSAIEQIGTWGQEDDPLFPVEINRNSWLHNCNYPNTIWSQPFGIPNSPVCAVGGTYVGNGTNQTISLPLPVHFLMIRALSGGTAPIFWMGATLGGHIGGNIGLAQNTPIRVFCDALGQAGFTVAGADVNTNANAVTYQYIAFCDPGMRFMLCGATSNIQAAVDKAITLQSEDFLPQAGFIQIEFIGSATSGSQLSFKSPNHAGTIGTNINGNNIANWGTFGTGLLNMGGTINNTQHSQIAYTMLKALDDCANLMFQFTNYTGNGTNPRTIPLAPLSSRFPLFVMVIPRGANGFFRDPSHTSTNSANITSLANSTAAITGVGLDSITVNSTLNNNGVIYDVFAIPGAIASMANGIYIPTNCTAPPDAWGDPEPGDAPDIAILGEGGLILGGVSPLTILKDVSGIYTVVPGKHDDTLYDRQSGQPSVDVKIPDPTFKTGYIGG